MRETLEKLFAQQILSREESARALLCMAGGAAPPAQMAAFLTVFRMRAISVDELLGFRDALLELAVKPVLEDFSYIDVCGTGGDGKSSFNISTLAALVAAACGVRVAKHGNYAVSSSCGSSNLLEALGVKFTSDSARLNLQLERSGICFLHAPLFHPVMKNFAAVRKEMSLKTFFNILGPLVNPASPRVQLCGVYNLFTLRLYRQAAQAAGRDFTVVHSLDGFDEVSLTARFKVSSPRGEREYDPEDLGFARVNESDIRAGRDVAESAALFKKILEGRGSAAQNNVVCANAAFAIRAARREEGSGSSLIECLQEAGRALESGAAQAVLKKHLELQG